MTGSPGSVTHRKRKLSSKRKYSSRDSSFRPHACMQSVARVQDFVGRNKTNIRSLKKTKKKKRQKTKTNLSSRSPFNVKRDSGLEVKPKSLIKVVVEIDIGCCGEKDIGVWWRRRKIATAVVVPSRQCPAPLEVIRETTHFRAERGG